MQAFFWLEWATRFPPGSDVIRTDAKESTATQTFRRDVLTPPWSTLASPFFRPSGENPITTPNTARSRLVPWRRRACIGKPAEIQAYYSAVRGHGISPAGEDRSRRSGEKPPDVRG